MQFKQAEVEKEKKKRIPQLMDYVATTVVEQGNSNTAEVCNDRALSRQLSLAQTTVWKCMQFILNAYRCKIHPLKELKPGGNNLRETFSLKFLAHMELEQNWPWNILKIEKAHFYMGRTVIT